MTRNGKDVFPVHVASAKADVVQFFAFVGPPRRVDGFLEQKGTKKTKGEFFFVGFACFCRDCFPRAAGMENPQSAKILPRMARMARMGTNAECSPRKTWQGMQNAEILSVKSDFGELSRVVKCAVQFAPITDG